MDIFKWTFDPWSGIRQLRDEMEGALERFSGALGRRESQPPLSIFQDADGVTVMAELPGVALSGVTVEMEGDRLRLSARRSRPEGAKDEQYHRQERAVGEFVREVRLPAGLDADKIEAKLADGILTVRLPKAESARPRKVVVKAD